MCVSTVFQTAPAQENPSEEKTLKNMQLDFTACRKEKLLFFGCFLLVGHTFFDFIARSHTLLFSSLLFLFLLSLLTIGLLLHTTRCGCSILLQSSGVCVCVCCCMNISKKIFSNPFFSRHRGTHSRKKEDCVNWNRNQSNRKIYPTSCEIANFLRNVSIWTFVENVDEFSAEGAIIEAKKVWGQTNSTHCWAKTPHKRSW